MTWLARSQWNFHVRRITHRRICRILPVAVATFLYADEDDVQREHLPHSIKKTKSPNIRISSSLYRWWIEIFRSMFSSRCKHGKVEFISKSSQSHCEIFPRLYDHHRKCFQFRLLPNWLVGSFSVEFPTYSLFFILSCKIGKRARNVISVSHPADVSGLITLKSCWQKNVYIDHAGFR